MRSALQGSAALLLVGVVAHCATGGDDPGAASTTVNWSTASVGGSMGGAAGMPGTGATGAPTSSTGGGAGSPSTGGSGSGGAPTSGTLVLLARGSMQGLGGVFHEGQGWITATLAGAGLDRPDVTLLSDGTAVGLMRGDDDHLRYTVWNQTSWSPLSDVGSMITTRSSPALGAIGSAAHAVYHGVTNYMHYYAAYAGQWAPTNEGLAPPNQDQSFGPTGAAMATVGTEVIVVFAGSDTFAYVQARNNGTWNTAVPITGTKVQLTPAIATMSSGPELMLVYAHHEPNQFNDKKLFWTTRNNGIWTTPQKIDDTVFTDEPVRVAALAGGDALLSYRGTDGKAYWLRYSAGSWSVPAAIANPNPTVTSAPDVATGIGSAEAELVYVDAQDTTAYHARLSVTWSVPTVIGGTSLANAAIDSAL